MEGGCSLEQRPHSSALDLKDNSFETQAFNCRSLTPWEKKKKTNVEEIMELEKNCLVIIMIITDSGKHHQRVIKLAGEISKNNTIIASEYLLTR